MSPLSFSTRRLAPALTTLLFASAAAAQSTPTEAADNPSGVAPPSSQAATAPAQDDAFTSEDVQQKLKPVPGGLTADYVGMRARTTSVDVEAKSEALRAAAAKVDQAIVQYFPRVSGTASYTHLSPIKMPSLGGGGSIVGAGVPSGTVITEVSPTSPLQAVSFSFPVILDQYSIQGSITVPLTDYLTRIIHAHSSASHSEEAARLDKIASEAKAVTDGKISFYNWAKSISQREVLEQARAARFEHVKDAEALFKAGQAAKADLLSAQSQASAAELSLAQADEMVRIAEEQLRIYTRQADSDPVLLGEDVLSVMPPVAVDLAAMREEAYSQRAEMRALIESERSLESMATVARASAWPQISAFGDIVYANPNQRYVPQSETWNFTWDVGLRASWSPNDLATGLAAGAEANANAAKLRAQVAQVRDAISIEVAQAVFGLRTADTNVETASKGLAAAEEAYRVRREAYRVGRATNVDLTDAQSDLIRAGLASVTARIDQRVARLRLEHATGRDIAKLKDSKNTGKFRLIRSNVASR